MGGKNVRFSKSFFRLSFNQRCLDVPSFTRDVTIAIRFLPVGIRQSTVTLAEGDARACTGPTYPLHRLAVVLSVSHEFRPFFVSFSFRYSRKYDEQQLLLRPLWFSSSP